MKVAKWVRDDDVELRFSGVLDETGELPDLSTGPYGHLTMNLEHLRGINSLGCRKWALWMREQTLAFKSARLTECGPAIVNQINALGGFIPPHVTIASLYAPYACTHCAHTTRIRLVAGKDFTPGTPPSIAETMTCGECQRPMDLDVVRERYFAFLRAV